MLKDIYQVWYLDSEDIPYIVFGKSSNVRFAFHITEA